MSIECTGLKPFACGRCDECESGSYENCSKPRGGCRCPKCLDERLLSSAPTQAPSALGAETKDPNPKDHFALKKVPLLSVLSGPALAEFALGMQDGAHKYGRQNYRASGVTASVMLDAMMRHALEWWEGADLDADTIDGIAISNIARVGACALILLDAYHCDNLNDDRPLQVKNLDWLKNANARAKALAEAHKTHKPPHTQKEKKP